MSAAAVYRGEVRHRRLRGEAPADFTHALSLLYLDLGELPRLLGGRLVRRRPGLVRIRPRDLHGAAADFDGVRAALRRTVAEQSGRPAPTGAIGVLTHPRVAGLCFNPVSFYYLFDDAGELDAVVAEVTNTPFRERHAYVLRAPTGLHGADVDPRTARGALRGEHLKAMRVSPLQPMAQRYEWTVTPPARRIAVAITNRSTADGAVDLVASLSLAREPLTAPALRAFLLRHPAGTARILALIYGRALVLWLRGARVHGRGAGAASAPSPSSLDAAPAPMVGVADAPTAGAGQASKVSGEVA